MGAISSQTRSVMDDRVMHAAIARQLLGGELVPPPTLGRFVVLDRVGAGGMGTVYRAYDPELDRRIALKVLLPERLASPRASNTLRLRREATALARLNHPNVVGIYEVGTAGNEVFLAMEYVEGLDLHAWADAHPVGSRERMTRARRLLVQAAHGLHAAHEAGLVHRDFKPSNVLVGDDGRVRVADFGLARSSADPNVAITKPQHRDAIPSTAATTVTRAGDVVGTPQYMAPEQEIGGPTDARTDQFAFCVTAWEVLFGAPPWPTLPMAEDPPSAPPGASRSLVAALRTGLAADPTDRHRTLAPLIDALAAKPRRTRWILGGTAIVLGAGVATWAALRSEPCADAGAGLAEVWNDTRRQAIRTSILDTNVPYAEAAWASAETDLDAFADAWTDGHRDACQATLVRREQSEGAMDRRMACLAQRRRALGALVDVLSDADAAVVERAATATGTLPSVDLCAQADYVLTGFDPLDDPERAAAATSLRDAIARAAALHSAGKFAEGLALLDELEPATTRLGHPPLGAEWARRAGQLAAALEHPDVAEGRLLAAFALATEASAPREAFAAAASLSELLGVQLEDQAAAARWLKLAEGHAGPDPESAATLAVLRGRLELAAGKFGRALDEFEAGAAHYAASGGEHDPRIPMVLARIAVCQQNLGRFPDAEKTIARAVEQAEASLGAHHPEVGRSLALRGQIEIELGQPKLARKHFTRALEIQRRAYGEVSTEVARIKNALGNVAQRDGDLDAALGLFEAAIAADEAVGTVDRSRLGPLMNKGSVLLELGRLEEAAAVTERSLALTEQLLGADHPQAVVPVFFLAKIRNRAGQFGAAVPLFERALRIMEAGHGTDSRHVELLLGDIAIEYMKTQHYSEALPLLERRRATIERLPPGHDAEVAQPLHNMGVCHRNLGDHEAARRSYQASLDAMKRAGEPLPPHAARPVLGLSAVALATGDLEQAREHARRALELVGDTDDRLQAEARFADARAMWGLGRERSSAIALAEAAAGTFAALGARGRDDEAEVRAWIAARVRSAREP